MTQNYLTVDPEKMICPYCGKKAKLVNGDKIYPYIKKLGVKKFWMCSDCEAYVGCHRKSVFTNFKNNVPLGRLANKKLRWYKVRVHELFDKCWKGKGRKARTRAYKRFAKIMDMPTEECHIGMFDVETCKKAIKLLKIETKENL